MIDLKKMAMGVAAAVLLSAAPSLAATFVLDDFSTAPHRAVDEPFAGSSNVSSVAFRSGERILTAENTANNGFADAATTLAVAGGRLSFSNDDQATGRGTLTYTNVGDIVLGPKPFFLFDVGFFDGVANFFASVTDTMGRTSTYSELLQPGFNPRLLFSQFTGTADFNIVQELAFAIDTTGGVRGVDGSLERITISAIPLPAGGLLLVFGLGGLAALRRKKVL